MTTGTWEFLKGEGTGNDFVVIPDLDGSRPLTPGLVEAICDRRFGLGADGVLRVVPTKLEPEAADLTTADFFMDYRNADGSLAQMCGNGARVVARYLVTAGLVEPGQFELATRGGTRTCQAQANGPVTVDMGPVLSGDEVSVRVGEREWPATAVFVPNPHAVAFVDDLAQAGDLKSPPDVGPPAAFPDGVNVEFVAGGGAEISMRVFERGVGETLSCGTGACAAAWAAMRRDGVEFPATYRVRVPGGTVEVTVRPDGHALLTGPAVLLARGELDSDWVAAHT
jgi:diaminopimelate epimerase